MLIFCMIWSLWICVQFGLDGITGTEAEGIISSDIGVQSGYSEPTSDKHQYWGSRSGIL